MVRLIRFLRGYVQIKVWGYSPERLMNLCGNHDILLWNIENHGTYYTMCVSVSGFFRMKNCLKKTRTRASVQKRAGLPFFWPGVWKRKIFVAGLLGCVCFLFLMSRFVWAIDIEGNQAVTDELLLDFLEENGVRAGVRRTEIACPELEEKMRAQFDRIIWTSVQLEGTRLLIRVRENEHPAGEDGQDAALSPETSDPLRGTDLRAAQDGQIVRMITRSGLPLKKPGDTVQKGEVLVQGRVPIYNDDGTVRQMRFCDADADIEIRYALPVSETLPASYLAKAYTGRTKTRPFVHTLRRSFGLPRKAPFLYCDSVTQERQTHLFGSLYLPLFTGTVTYREYLPTELRHSLSEARTLLEERLETQIRAFEEKGVHIIQKNVTIRTEEEQYTLSGKLLAVSGAVRRTGTEEEAAPGQTQGTEEEATPEQTRGTDAQEGSR